jgi:hypothetical protein
MRRTRSRHTTATSSTSRRTWAAVSRRCRREPPHHGARRLQGGRCQSAAAQPAGNMQRAPCRCNVRRTRCRCNARHAICSMQHAAYNMIALCPAAGADSLRTTPRRCTPPGRATRGPLEPHHTYSRCGCMRHASPPPISGLCTCAGGSFSQRHPSQVQPRPRGIPGKALWPPPVDVSNERSRLRVPRRFMAEAISTRPLGRIRPRF